MLMLVGLGSEEVTEVSSEAVTEVSSEGVTEVSLALVVTRDVFFFFLLMTVFCFEGSLRWLASRVRRMCR